MAKAMIRTKLAAGVALTTAASVAAVGGYAFAATRSSESQFPTTPNGLTYGSLPDKRSDVPDLVKVVGVHGVVGYVRSSELLGSDLPANPQEVTKWQAAHGADRTVDVLAEDGATVVDSFIIQGSDPQAAIEVQAGQPTPDLSNPPSAAE